MATKTSRMIFDCSTLPYSREGAAISSPALKRMEKSLPARSDDPDTFRLRQLIGRPILQWPPTIPEYDLQGVRSSKSFECWKKARDGRTGLSSNSFCLKTGKVQSCHSFLETKLRAAFEMCPYVIDIRTQYPSWDSERYRKYIADGKPIPKNFVMTIDFMLTVALPWVPYPHYHGVSGKPRALIESVPVLRRHKRERSTLGQVATTHEVMDEFEVSDCEYLNHTLIHSWMLRTDIERTQDAAALFSAALHRSRIAGNLHRVLSMISKRLAIEENRGYSLFAVAVFLGYIVLNHKFPVRPNQPLHLL